ncbi:type IV pilus modification PilV family protein [Microbacterium trichothecenolyticum]|nr:type II secretion system protein [Microbacterium trichothecenolyticum]
MIEIIIGMILLAIIAVAILPALWQGIQYSSQQAATATATRELNSVIEGIRENPDCGNALDFDVDDATGTELRVRTSLGGNLACQASLLKDGDARFTTSSGALPALASDWARWENGIAQYASTPFFVENGDVVTYTFDIETDSAPVRFSGEAAARSTATGVSLPCW